MFETPEKKILSTLLKHEEGLRFKDLEKETGLSPPTLSKWLKRLEAEKKIMRVIIPGKDGVYYKLIDPLLRKYKVLSYWVIRNTIVYGYNLSRKYKLDEILTYSWAYGTNLLVVFEALRKTAKKEDYLMALPIITANTANTLLDWFEAEGESLYLNEKEIEDQILEILKISSAEEAEEKAKEIVEDLKKFIERISEEQISEEQKRETKRPTLNFLKKIWKR